MLGPLIQSEIGREFLEFKYLPTVDKLLEYRSSVKNNSSGVSQDAINYELYIVDELLKLRAYRDEVIGKRAIITNDEILKSSSGFEVTIITVNFATDIPERGYTFIVQDDDVNNGAPFDVQIKDLLIK
jgi:hypothetical protein